MATATELHALAELYHADTVTVLLTEECDGTQLLGLLDGYVAVVLEGNVLTYLVVDETLHLTNLLGGHLLEMREVKTQVVGSDERTLLLHMLTQHLAESLVQEVRTGMVGLAGMTLVGIHAGHEFSLRMLGQRLGDVYGQVVLVLGVHDFDGLLTVHQHTAVTHLTTLLGIERRLVEHQLVVGLLLLRHLTVAQDVAGILREVPSHELRLHGLLSGHLYPVPILHGCSVACALLLLLHLGIKSSLIHRHAMFTADKFGEVEGETIGVEERESLVARNLRTSGLASLLDDPVEQADAILQGAQEAVLLLLHHLHDEVLLGRQFGEGLSHLLNERGHEGIHESLLLSQEGITIAYGTSEDASDDIARLGIARQLSVGDAEGDGTQVVHDDAQGHVGLLVLPVLHPGHVGHGLDEGLEDIRVIVRLLALDGTYQTLEAHTRVDDIHAQWFQVTVSLALILHEDDVPYLNDLWVILVHQFTSGHLGLLLGRTAVEVNLRTGAAGTRVTHLPEVVVLVAVDDVVGRHMLEPEGRSLLVAGKVLTLVTLKDGDVEVLGVDFQHIDQVFPCHVDGSLLEIVTEGPVAQHLEHGVVVRVVAHLLQVVVLATDAETLLGVGAAAGLGVTAAQDDVLPLVHAGVGKHKGGVVLDDHRGRGDDEVAFRLKELLERIADFFCC